MSTGEPAKSPRELAIEQIGPIHEATSAADAVGRWWGHAILSAHMDAGAGANDKKLKELEDFATLQAMASMSEYAAKAVNIAETLTQAITEHPEWVVSNGVRSDYRPDRLLGAVVEFCGVPQSMVPIKTSVYTRYSEPIADNAVIFGRLGYEGEPEQIWPPVPPQTDGHTA